MLDCSKGTIIINKAGKETKPKVGSKEYQFKVMNEVKLDFLNLKVAVHWTATLEIAMYVEI